VCGFFFLVLNLFRPPLLYSESCVLIPAAVYLSNPKYHAMLEQDPRPPMVAKVTREVDVSMDIASRASTLLGVNVVTVEPLQLVRYMTPDAHYQLHHDHGGYYHNTMEARLWTMLIFLNDLDADAGGHTAFPKLGLEVVPRRGDALVWSNVDRQNTNNEVDPDMVHMGLPPSKENVEKYAMNVWFGEESYFNRIASGKWNS
jgi:hypothetical protein